MKPPVIAFNAGFLFRYSDNLYYETYICSEPRQYDGSNPFWVDDDAIAFEGLLSVSAITCEINPLEAIIDSSPITIEIAADAGPHYFSWINYAGYPYMGYKIRDLLSAKPSFSWVLAQTCTTTDTQIVVQGDHSSYDGPICCGLENAVVGDGVFDGTNTTFDFWGRWSGHTYKPYPHYVDPDLGYAPAVTDVPTVWKGRECEIWVSVPFPQIAQNNQGTDPILYRRCVYADAPQLVGNKYVITVVPIDSRIRDRQASAHLPGVAHLGLRPNSAANGRRVRKIFAIGQPTKRHFEAAVANGSDAFSLGSSGFQIYKMLYSLIQPAAGMPPGRTAQDISTPGSFGSPQNPRLDADTQILYRSGTTAYFGSTMTFDGTLWCNTLPSFRWYATATSTTLYPLERIFSKSNSRASTPTTAADNEPIIGFASPYDGRVQSTQGLFNYRVGSAAGEFHWGLLWSRTYSGEEIPPDAEQVRGMQAKNNWCWLIPQKYGVSPRNYSISVDEGCNADGIIDGADNYSVKPASAADLYIERWRGYTSDRAGDVETVALWAVEYGQSKSAAFVQTDHYYVAGEPYIWLDRQLAPTGVQRWYSAHWTEDGNSWHDRRLKLQYLQDDGADGHRYQVIETPRPRFAGIGDWFGYQAELTIDPAVYAANDGELIVGILAGNDGGDATNPSSTGLNISDWEIDIASFYNECGHSALVREYGFESLNAIEDNLIALLLFSGTAISCTCNYGYDGYAIRRVNMGAPSPDEVCATITDDDLLEPPSAMLSGDILAKYVFRLPDDVTYTYVDAVAKNVLNAEKTLEFDFTHCSIAEQTTRNQIANVIRGELATLVDRYGSESLEYTIKVPWCVGGMLTPGDAITLTSKYGTGPASATPPNNVLCRVLSTTQDLIGYTSTIKCRAFAGYSARYQAGATVLSWDSANFYYYCDTVDGLAVGDTVVTDTGVTLTISSIAFGAKRIKVSGSTFYPAVYLRRSTGVATRFYWGPSWMI